MARNNAGRTGAPATPDEATIEASADSPMADTTSDSLSFVSPTEFVELPSRGKHYPAGHPLLGEETIEVRYMTAKDEDIITSSTLLKRGLAIERLMQSLVVNKAIKPHELLVGDRSAIIVAARIGAYGNEYNTNITCPRCGTHSQTTFDLSEIEPYCGDDWGDFAISETGNGTFNVELPRSGATVEIRLMTGRDEANLLQARKKKKKHNISEGNSTETLKTFVVSVNGSTDTASVRKFVEDMPAFDARYLRVAQTKVTPNMDTLQDYVCPECSHEAELEVPFTTDFFWPK
jgi:rubredoxin